MHDGQIGMKIWPLDSFSLLEPENCFPKRRSDLYTRVIDGETVVLDRKGSLIHQLNQTASYIWDRCDGKSARAEIASQLAEEFDIDPETVARDVAGIVGQLQSLNLLQS
jgi:hypothetical protein